MFKMAALFSLVQEILPMIMPSSISVTKASDILPLPLSAEADQDGADSQPRIRVLSRDAVVDKTDKMCASGKMKRTPQPTLHKSCHSSFETSTSNSSVSNPIPVLLVTAQSSSTVRHHGEQGTNTAPEQKYKAP